MDFSIILFTGSIGFVCMALFKLITKKAVVYMKTDISEKTVMAFVYLMVFMFCLIIYAIILNYIGNRHVIPDLHFKLCYVIKAWTVSVSLNAVYEHLILGQKL